jgi:putrescine transport system substrate-binding protein
MRITTTITRPSFLILVLGLSSCSEDAAIDRSGENVVNVYNWADYIAMDVIDEFEAEYGIEVNYDTYDSNEVVDVKLLAGGSGYDVVIHSSQFSARLAPIGVFDELDFSRFTNLDNLDQELWNRIAYPAIKEYSIPYHWGSTGYAWNVDMVRQRLPDHPMDSMDVLFDPDVVSKLADCGVTLLDGPTDLFPMVLAYLGREPNAVDDESLAAAEAQIKLVRPYIRYFSNTKMLSDLPNKEVCVAMSWSGDYSTAAARAREAGLGIELRYTTPKEGSGLWVDGVFIPRDAPHKDNAYLFMDFIMRADIAGEIANMVRYANVNKAAREFTLPELLNDEAIYPSRESWEVMYPIQTVHPKRERPRTRAFARAKSGI